MHPLIFIHNSTTFDYTSWFRESLTANNIPYQVEIDPTLPLANFSLLRVEGRTIGLDWDDGTFDINPLIDRCDLCLKANLSSDLVRGESFPDASAETFQTFREQYQAAQDRIRPWILGRAVRGGRVTPIEPRERQFFIVSYSAGAGSRAIFGQARERLYNLIATQFGNQFALAYPGHNAAHIIPSLADYENYLQFIGEGYFLLNLVGSLGSNPFRCVDGCLARTCVITDRIYADAYKDFPAFILPADTLQNHLPEHALRAALDALFACRGEYHEHLLREQEIWFDTHLSMRSYAPRLIESLQS